MSAVSVTTDANSQYKLSGAAATASVLFAALSGSANVNVRGNLDPTNPTLTAAVVSREPLQRRFPLLKRR